MPTPPVPCARRLRALSTATVWLALFAAGALAPPAQAAKKAKAKLLEGQVVQVIDGDSLVFQAVASAPGKESAPMQVRLLGIDAPEGCQDWGGEAREALRAHVQGREVQLLTQGLDSYRRTLAVLRVDGVDVNERLVADGHAWSQRFHWDKGPYVEKERVAKALKRGLHAQPGALLPREFRQRHGACDAVPAAPASAPAPG